MKIFRILFFPLVFLLIAGFTGPEKIKLLQTCYGPNEVLEYRLHYGFMNAGEAVLEVHPKLYMVNNKVCYKATVTGKSTGAFDLALRIRDTWGSFIDTSVKVPHKSYRIIEEGKYKLKEQAIYDYQGKVVNVERETKDQKKAEKYEISDHVQDIVSGYYYLRLIDYDRLKVDDTITIDAFFEDKMYDFSVRYLGKSKVSTKFGNIQAIKLSPVMPDNELFKGGNSIRMYLSDDKNRIPLKVEAEMFVGAVEVDLKKYQGLKYPLNFSK
ncbi:MAG: DUF3108 domain-containing protein [Cytophagaceae bacterium]